MRKCSQMPYRLDHSQRCHAKHRVRLGPHIAVVGVPSTSTTFGRGIDAPKACSPLSRQRSRRGRSPSCAAGQPFICKNSLPPEGHSPVTHIHARISCACEQCLLALHASPQTRSIAIEVAHERQLNSVIPEGDEEGDPRSRYASPVKASSAKPCTAGRESTSDSAPFCVLPVPSKLMSADSNMSHSTAPLRSATSSPAPCSGAIPEPSSSLRHCQKVAGHTDHHHDVSQTDSVFAWYTPFGSTTDTAHAQNSASKGSNASPNRVARCVQNRAKRACRHGAQHAAAKPDYALTAPDSCASFASSNTELLEGCRDFDRSPRCKNAVKSRLRNSCSSKMMTKTGQYALSINIELQRSVTSQTVPAPFPDHSTQLPQHASGCTSAELASLCLPSVTLTTTGSPSPAQTVPTSANRLNSCPSLPAAQLCQLWANG
jgi:hypothetical protein